MGEFVNNYTINDIFEDFELIKENILGNESPSLRWIRESQGIIDNYYSIIDEIYDAMVNAIKFTNNDSYSYIQYVLNNYEIKQDCFLKTVNIRVLAGRKGPNYHGSHFERNYDNIELSSDLKLLNAKFTIGINDNELFTKESKNAFFRKMAHELQHAFRYYNICISNNASIENERTSVARYGNIVNTLSNKSNETYANFLAPNLYMISKNEIMSEAQELYEYIRQHEEINSSNLDKWLGGIPLYWRISRSGKFLKYLDNIMFNEKNWEKIDEIGNAYIKLMNFSSTTPHKAFLKCRQKAIGVEEYVRGVFFRTVNKAFDDFNRKIVNNKDIDLRYVIEKNEHFSLLKEILNKH